MLKLENNKKMFLPELIRTQLLTNGNFAINSIMHRTFFSLAKTLFSLFNGTIFSLHLWSPLSHNAHSLSWAQARCRRSRSRDPFFFFFAVCRFVELVNFILFYFFCSLWVCWIGIFLVDFFRFVGLLNRYIFGWFFAVCGFVELVYFWLIFCGLWVCWISIFLVDFFCNWWVCWTGIFLVDFLRFMGLLN